MNTDLSPEATQFGDTVRQALAAAGGDELAPAGPTEPDGGEVAKVLSDLGAWDLDPRSSTDELEAAAALCRGAGWWALPHPVAERVARPRDVEADALVVVAGGSTPTAIDRGVAGLDLRWVAVDLGGRRSRATPQPDPIAAGKPGVTVPLDVSPIDEAGDGDVAVGVVLPCWTLLGMLDRAVDLTADYVRQRHQFGQPLSSFQGVQFQLTEAEVERVGVQELAKHALWSLATGQPDALVDALALRLAAIEAAEVVFRVTHQLHGAIGFCDETALSWLSRASQATRRLPLGPSATRAALTAQLGRRGLTGLFS